MGDILIYMKQVDYSYMLTEVDKISVAFNQNQGEITFFKAQYSALIQGRWRSVMRFDSCHGYAHKHTFHLSSEQYIIDLTRPGDNLNDVFTESVDFLKGNFESIKNNYINT